MYNYLFCYNFPLSAFCPDPDTEVIGDFDNDGFTISTDAVAIVNDRTLWRKSGQVPEEICTDNSITITPTCSSGVVQLMRIHLWVENHAGGNVTITLRNSLGVARSMDVSVA